MGETKCLICGMKVRSSAFDLNKHSFIEKNTEENIVYCPFCGVSRVYLKDKEAVYKEEIEKMDEETLKALQKAMKLEVFNGEFYKEASILAKNQDNKKAFEDLSNIEFMHARVHMRLGGFKELPSLRKPDYTRHNTDELLLQEAYKREHHAISFYKRNSSIVCSEIIKEVFNALSEVEKQHMILTGK